MALNKNELVLDRVRSLTTYDLATDQMLFRLTSLEDPSLQCSAEGEEVTDAVGALITTLYRAKQATFSATNSLISLDLAAAQYGSTKEVASATDKILDRTYEILTVTGAEGEVIQTRNAPKDKNKVLWIYSILNNEIGTAYQAAATASATEFVISDEGVITPPTGFTGKLYIEYDYETENAVRVVNKASEFPESCKLVIFVYFRDRCNDNIVYSGKIICPKAKLNPEQVELALTSTGKHAFTFNMMKDYCIEEGEDQLFSIIVSA